MYNNICSIHEYILAKFPALVGVVKCHDFNVISYSLWLPENGNCYMDFQGEENDPKYQLIDGKIVDYVKELFLCHKQCFICAYDIDNRTNQYMYDLFYICYYCSKGICETCCLEINHDIESDYIFYRCPFCRQYNSHVNSITLGIFTNEIERGSEYIELMELQITVENKYAQNYETVLREINKLTLKK
jgi:hypothetical protein